MRKKICFLLVLVLVGCFAAVPTMATEDPAAYVHRIESLDDFLRFASNCTLDTFSQGKVFSLETDIDLSNTAFSGIPIFGGHFMGNHHTISGLSISQAGSFTGLFRHLNENAIVEDVAVEGQIKPIGSGGCAGGIAGSNSGIIRGCSFLGSISGSEKIGGIAGENKLTGSIINCTAKGSIHGTHFVGGISGENTGVIRNSRNYASINTTVEQTSISIEDISLQSITNTESSATVTDIGGISGSGTGVIRGCENRGTVGYPQVGYNVGGIAGSFSGYLTDCLNCAPVYGRKDVGGILGQLEPAIDVEFEVDTLQTLQGQMEEMASTTHHTAATAQSASASIIGQIGNIENQIALAQNAIDTLLPSQDNTALPDADAITAAQSALSGSIASITGSLESMGNTAQGTIGSIYQDIQVLGGQMGNIGATLGSASEGLGGSISDVSDNDGPEDTSAKVESCRNLGAVQGDWNIGGIVGAVDLENDLDPSDDIRLDGSLSMNFDCRLRAVVTNCENTGTLEARKRNSGGIAGMAALGLIRQCSNTGDSASAQADYVGGIAGNSQGLIRSCITKCTLEGESYVGGIAGAGVTVSDCRAMVKLVHTGELAGSILGQAEDISQLHENYYLAIGNNIGAVDGINYRNKAEYLSAGQFLKLPEIPESFSNVLVTFCFPDGAETTLSVPFASKLANSMIPEVPAVENAHGYWAGPISPKGQLFFDTVFTADYTEYVTVLESQAEDSSGKPLLLVQGAFTDVLPVVISPADHSHASWNIVLPQSSEAMTLRLLNTTGIEPEKLRLTLRTQTQDWAEATFSVEGSYLVFQAPTDTVSVALDPLPPNYTPMILIGVLGSSVLISILALLLNKRRNKKK